MFGSEVPGGGVSEGQLSKEDKLQIHNKYVELKADYLKFRDKAKNSYDYYNLIEKSILEMENDES